MEQGAKFDSVLIDFVCDWLDGLDGCCGSGTNAEEAKVGIECCAGMENKCTVFRTIPLIAVKINNWNSDSKGNANDRSGVMILSTIPQLQ